MKSPAVPFAQLFDIIGRARMMEGILFVPALLEIEEPAVEFHQTLEAYFSSAVDGPVIVVAGEEISWLSGIWLRARIPKLFHFQPPLCLGNTGDPLNVGFLAVSKFGQPSILTAYPFACVNTIAWDDYCASEVGVIFSSLGPSPRIQDRITRAFWRLLRQHPAELVPYEDYDLGRFDIHGYTGQHFIHEQSDAESGEGLDSHFFLSGEQFLCYDCDGTGIEFEFPYTEDCATCGGHGYISWRFNRSDSSRWDESAW